MSSPKLSIRLAELDDLGSILGLYSQLNPEDPELIDDREQKTLAYILKSPELSLFLGEMDGSVVATCYLNIVPNLSRQASPFGVIENVVTDRNWHNHGFGKQMMQHALAAAWSAGCYKVMLQTGSTRESTHQFYTDCGFTMDDRFAFVARPGAQTS